AGSPGRAAVPGLARTESVDWRACALRLLPRRRRHRRRRTSVRGDRGLFCLLRRRHAASERLHPPPAPDAAEGHRPPGVRRPLATALAWPSQQRCPCSGRPRRARLELLLLRRRRLGPTTPGISKYTVATPGRIPGWLRDGVFQPTVCSPRLRTQRRA